MPTSLATWRSESAARRALVGELERGVEDRAAGALLALHPGDRRLGTLLGHALRLVVSTAVSTLTAGVLDRDWRYARMRFSVRTFTELSGHGGIRWVSATSILRSRGGRRARLAARRRPLPRAGQPDVGRPRGPRPHRRRPPRGRRPRPPAGRHDHPPAHLDLARPPRRPARPARRRGRRRPSYDAGLHDLQPRLAARRPVHDHPARQPRRRRQQLPRRARRRPARWSTCRQAEGEFVLPDHVPEHVADHLAAAPASPR